MNNHHLKEGEVEDLDAFLRTAIDFSEGWDDDGLKEEVMAICTEIEAYKERSTYGRNREEILENARKHFLNCPDCLDKYKKVVHKSVYRTLSTVFDHGYARGNFTDAFWHHVEETDRLGVLKRDN